MQRLNVRANAPCEILLIVMYAIISVPQSLVSLDQNKNQFLPCETNSCVTTFVRLLMIAVRSATIRIGRNPSKLSPYSDSIHPDSIETMINGIKVDIKFTNINFLSIE